MRPNASPMRPGRIQGMRPNASPPVGGDALTGRITSKIQINLCVPDLERLPDDETKAVLRCGFRGAGQP